MVIVSTQRAATCSRRVEQGGGSELVVEFACDAHGLTGEEELRVVEHLVQREAPVRVDVGQFDERERLALRVRRAQRVYVELREEHITCTSYKRHYLS